MAVGGSFNLYRPFRGGGKETTREKRLGPAVSGGLPPADVGGVVPWVQARQRIERPNCIWYGNLEALTETRTETTSVNEGGVTTTTTVTTKTVVGFLVDVQLALGLGPGLHLHKIFSDDLEIWSGDIGPARTQVVMPQSDDMMNGVTVTFAGGAFDQAPDPIITTADTPGYVGTAYIIIQGMRADAKISSLSFEVSRFPNPLGLDTAILKNGDDINVASATVDWLTNGWGGGGLDIAEVDTASFITAANTLDTEENFCAMTIASEVAITRPLTALQDQADMFVFQDPASGKIACKLLRPAEINRGLVPRFYYKNVQDIRDFDKSGWQQTIEQLRGIFYDRSADYKETPVFWQNPANMALSGRGKRTASVEYPYCMDGNLCLDLVARDGAVFAYPSFRFSMVTNRDGAALVPGDVISITWGNYQLLNLLAVVLRVRKHPLNDNDVTVTCRQVIFPNTAAIFGVPGAGYDPGIDLNPHTPTGLKIVSAPFWIMRARGLMNSDQTAPIVAPVIMPVPYNDVQLSYHAYVSNFPGVTGDTIFIEDGVYPTFGDLGTTLSMFDGTTTGEVATVLIDNVTNPNMLRDIAEAGVRDGELFLFVGDEIMSFEGVTDMGSGTWQLDNVHRALLDTVPGSHNIGDDCYIINNNYRNVPLTPFDYPIGYVPAWKIISNSPQRNGYFSEALASTAFAPTTARALHPPRPHDTKIDGGARSSSPVALTIAASVTVTWKTRSRLATAVKLQLDAADASEVGDGGAYQVHRVYIRDSGGTLHDCGLTADSGSDNDLTFNVPAMATGAGFLFVRSELTLGGVMRQSLYDDRLPVTIS